LVSITTLPFPKVSFQQAFKTLCGLLGSILPKLRAPSTLYKYLFLTEPLNPGYKHSDSKVRNNGSLPNIPRGLSNITQEEPTPLFPLEALPTEIKLEILRHSPNTTALRALTHATRLYHQAYIPASQEIFMEVLTREMETHSLTTNDMSFFELDISQPSWRQLGLFHQRVRNSVPQIVTKERSLAMPILRSSTDSSFTYDNDSVTLLPGLPDAVHSLDNRQSIQFSIMLAFVRQTNEWRSWAPRGTYKTIVITCDRDVDWKDEGSTDSTHSSLQLHFEEDLNYPGCLIYILLQPYKVLESPIVR
jgi:hypothetical protein